MIKALRIEKHKVGWSVLVKDSRCDKFFWIDIHIENEDIITDWNMYIFNLNDKDDIFRRDYQSNLENFEDCTSVAIQFLEERGFIEQDHKAKWFSKSRVA